MSEITANVNSAECLKTMTGFGQDIVYNVCNGTQHVIPWGTIDWIGYILLMIIAGTIAIGFILGIAFLVCIFVIENL